ncbi:MAG: hypothetical protein ACRC8Y_07875 [Chroococcales cyanobacterium]
MPRRADRTHKKSDRAPESRINIAMGTLPTLAVGDEALDRQGSDGHYRNAAVPCPVPDPTAQRSRVTHNCLELFSVHLLFRG